MKTVRYYDDIFQAHADREYLAEQGIPAEVFNENTGFVLPITYANPTMRPYIAVPDSCYEQAVELIGPEPEAGDNCPGCGSSDVEVALPKKHRWFTRCIMVPLMLFGTAGGNLRKVCRCNSCGREYRL
ncbi:MAG: DUF2007 domain-containing protein [Rikenellaceae bacterium]|nr:DUF2007 domain-containing protein [Rikenellaceae bacterium]